MFRETLEYRQERWVRAGFPVQGALKQVTLSQQLPRDFHEISGKSKAMKIYRIITSEVIYSFYKWEEVTQRVIDASSQDSVSNP